MIYYDESKPVAIEMVVGYRVAYQQPFDGSFDVLPKFDRRYLVHTCFCIEKLKEKEEEQQQHSFQYIFYSFYVLCVCNLKAVYLFAIGPLVVSVLFALALWFEEICIWFVTGSTVKQ